MKLADKAYLAGLIDGEGSISVSRTRTSAAAKGCRSGYSYRASLDIALVDLFILEWVKTVTGVGKICKVKTQKPDAHKQAYRWSAWSKEAAKLLKELLPYLKLKKAQAKNVIEFQSAMRQPGRSGLSEGENQFRIKCWEKSRNLNKRGVAL